MRLNRQWRQLTRDQKAAWRIWAWNNRVLLDNGVVRRGCAPKAFTIILKNRAVAGEALVPARVPATATWATDFWSVVEAGANTGGEGTITLRATNDLPAPSRWFVWATQPLLDPETEPLRGLRFVKCLAVPVIATDELTANFAADYQAVLGSFCGPGENGAWPEPHFVWFSVQQYHDGQLGPPQTMRGQIQAWP